MSKNEEFVVDKSNEAAYEVIRIISENASVPLYNPVILYGKSGTGKTHLVKLAEENLLKKDVDVIVLNGEELLSQLIYEIKNNINFSVDLFCKKYEETQVLIVEDIQYLEGKEATQECLTNITNYFEKHNKQIVFTMNCLPKGLETFNMQLRARFAYGLQIGIEEPTLELKMKLFEKLCKDKNWNISEEMKLRFADYIETPADVIGIMKQIRFYVENMNCPFNEELLEKVLRDRTDCELCSKRGMENGKD